MDTESVVDLLVAREYITQDQREDLIYAVEQSGKDVVTVVQDYQLLEPDQLFQLIADDIGGTYYDLSEFEPSPQVIATLPSGTARLHEIRQSERPADLDELAAGHSDPTTGSRNRGQSKEEGTSVVVHCKARFGAGHGGKECSQIVVAFRAPTCPDVDLNVAR